MTAEVKVKLVGMCDVCVHCGASRNVSASSNLREEAERESPRFINVANIQKNIEYSKTPDGSFTHPLIAIGTEQACVMALLHDNVGDPWLIVLLQADAGFPDGQQLIVQHL